MSTLDDKLLHGISYPENVSYLGDQPNFTRDSFDTISEMQEALSKGYIDEGHLSYCKEDGKHYKATKNGNTVEWKVFKPGGSNEGALGIYTRASYESLEEEDKPSRYILVPDSDLTDANAQEVEYKNYKTSEDGGVIDILFSAMRALQSKVARLENTFNTGLVSLNENYTAASVVIPSAEIEEEEPLWAMDPEDLSELTEASLSITSAPDLEPLTNVSYHDDHIEVTGLASKDLSQWTDFEASQEAKQCMYLISNVKYGAVIKVRLGFIDPLTEKYDPNGAILDIGRHLSEQKQNILLVVSRTIYDEDTEETYGKNYIWLSSSNVYRQEIFSKYFMEDLLSLSDSEKLLSKKYFIEEILLDNVSVWKCNFYVKEQAFTNISDVPSEKGITDDFTYKVAHLTIRSVKTYSTLQALRSRLLQNELVWVEDENKLYILSTEAKNIVSLGGGGGSHSDETTMTEQELIKLLQDAGYVTASEKLDTLRLSDFSGLTFIHTESGKKFNITIDSEGNFVSRQVTTSLLPDAGATTDNFAYRGAVARYNINGEVGTTDTSQLSGTTTNIIAKGDRVRFGSWYVPVKGQTQFNCSHDFIELVNSGTDDYPLDDAILIIVKGESYTSNGAKYLSKAEIDYFPLSGAIRKGSSYLIRGARHLDNDDPRAHIVVDTYDKELWKSGELFSLEKTVGMCILHKNGVYNSATGSFKFELTPVSLTGGDSTVVYDVPMLVSSPSTTNSYFEKIVNPYLIDAVFFVKDILRNGSNSNVWGAGNYNLIENAIVKDQYELDPAKQAFRCLTSKKETSNYRLDKVAQETIPLGDEKVSFYHSRQVYPITKFKPKASFENKNVCTDKTWLDNKKPNMPTVSFGIDMETTRCFNWISVGTFDEYVWIRQKGTDTWSTGFESYKAGDGEGITVNGQISGTAMQRKEFTTTVIDAAYKRIEGRLPALDTPYCVHKCVVYIGKPGTKQTYEYIMGRALKNGEPDLDHCSDPRSFTIYNSNSYVPIVYHITDQQGFGWMEYQVWSAAAEELLARINRETTEPSGNTKGTFPVLINTGDMTQNGTRINEWLDYYEGGRNLFDHLEQMNCVGNNDLGNSYDLTALGTGDDPGKSSPHFYYMCYCYEVDGENLSGKGQWTHPLVYNGVFVPSTYYFYFGNYGYVSVNSEITDTTCTAMFNAQGYNLYTGYTVGDSSYHINYSSGSTWCLARTISNMLTAVASKTTIVYCHEMPYTVITNDYLAESGKLGSDTNVNTAVCDRCCQYSSRTTKSALIGSHLNRISYKADYDNDDNYWFSRLLESKGIRLCIGGHKHSYTATWPVLEGKSTLKTGNYAGYDVSKLFVTVVSPSYYNSLPGTETTISGVKYKSFRLSSSCYNLLATTDANIGNSQKNGVVYFMCQATGYKLKSNKELPSVNQIYSIIVPKTDVANSKPHFSQESPMYVVYTYGTGVINIDLYRIVNIKLTAAAKITEFTELDYSTKPMLSEKLLINLEEKIDKAADGTSVATGIYMYNNYWLVPSGTPKSSYSFDYESSNSDRCWVNGNNVEAAGKTLSGLYDRNHTLTVTL